MFGQLIRRYREAAGLTLAEVAARTGIAVPNLSRIESGRTAVRSDTLARIAAALDARFTLEPDTKTLTLDDLRRRSATGRRTLTAVGLEPSDPASRLRAKAAAGIDTRAETAAYRP
jgi:transcriptional regulator with XRE-family HTH domain